MRLWRIAVAVIAGLLCLAPSKALANHVDCGRAICPHVDSAPGALTAAYLAQEPGGLWVASNSASAAPPYTYLLTEPCVSDDRNTGTCRPSDFSGCPTAPGRVIDDLVFEQRRLVLATPTGPSTIDGFDPGTAAPGTAVGPWLRLSRGCVDITALNPAPSPGEVFRYFQTLPLPELTVEHQPPGDGLVGLPVIFYTDGPTTQRFTVNIRGFTVDIVAGATMFTWHTGDGTDLTGSDPGAPYPDQTVTHDYASGTYTASLTTTWGATFSVDGGPSVAVPGTTSTDGPPVSIDVLQARPVLTNPFD